MRDLMGRTPVTIVTGFLGSGKTTLLNHLLTTGGVGRVAALVNDFGPINVDAALIAEVADEVIQLTNGCVCCTINRDLQNAAERVLALDPPVDRIVVETSGLSDPLPVGLTFLKTDLRRNTMLESVVTVVDCAHFALDLFKADSAMAQVLRADVLVLNKTDLASDDDVDAIEARIAVLKPRTRILRAAYGRVPVTSILDEVPISLLDEAAADQPDRHLISDGFMAHAFRVQGALRGYALQAWLDRGLAPGVFRAKGIVSIDDQRRRYVFQFCAGRSSFEPYLGPIQDTCLVFIGKALHEEDLRRQLDGCLVRG
jgi:G3E family GTPase